MTSEEKLEIKKKALAVGYNEKISFCCEECGRETTMRATLIRKRDILLCPSCSIKKGKAMRTPEQKRITHEKTVQTCMEKYGVPNGGASEVAKRKAEETWIQNWGSREECFKQRVGKAQKTFREKYNSTYSTPEIIKKKTETLIKKYGSVENSYKIRTQKAIETNLRNHNGHHNFVDPKWLLKRKEIMLERYGVLYPMQSEELRKEVEIKYGQVGSAAGTWNYEGKFFDSFWEISLYIVLKEHEIDFKYHPSLGLHYTDEEGAEKEYRPDFLVGDQIIEVKGDHFFDSKGEPVDCRGRVWKNKMKFMESLNVILITGNLKKINTNMKVLDIEPFLIEALELKGKPSKHAFIEKCKSQKSRGKGIKRVLYEEEEKLKGEGML